MNPDYIIGANNPHILYADYSGGRRAGGAIATPIAAEDPPVAEAPEAASPPPARVSQNQNDDRARTQGAPQAEEQELTFGDILDIINPLQHIPVLSQIYRAVTGDKISGFAQVAGGALFGGPLGLVGGVIEAAAEGVTGKGAGETFMASLFGETQETQIASSSRPPSSDESLETQVALASEPAYADQTLETQVAEASTPVGDQEELPKMATSAPPSGNDRLDTQIAQGMLPPVAPRTEMAEATKPKAPYGGVMDMTSVLAAKGPPNIADAADERAVAQKAEQPREDNQEAQSADAGNDKAVPISILPHAPGMIDGHRVYSLANVRRQGGVAPTMPAYSGPDVRLKPVSRQAGTTGRVAEPGPSAAALARSAAMARQENTTNAVDAEAARLLGLAKPAAPVAELESTPGLTPADADLMPSNGGSDPVPSALIEDMMRMGLDKYQKGLNNGTLRGSPGVDVRG